MPDPPETWVRLIVHVRFGEFVVAATFTVPANPLRGAIVAVELPAEPRFSVMLVGLAFSVKS